MSAVKDELREMSNDILRICELIDIEERWNNVSLCDRIIRGFHHRWLRMSHLIHHHYQHLIGI
jgi:hypothetical protein